MMTSFSELKRKDVINICDGKRLGNVVDLEIDQGPGCITAICVAGGGKMCFSSLLKGGDTVAIPYDRIRRIGDDVILVELDRHFFARPRQD
ncbi:MAG: YlmC/YmxH family sporulation protein [Christensenellales bacterium]|jgi:YlmC/YmxH family sporulation protein